MQKILFVDDEENLCFLFKKFFEKKKYEVITANNINKALDILSNNNFDLVISDITMPEKSGIDLLKNIKKINNETYVILITGNPSIQTATEAVRENAFDYIIKPFNMSILNEVINKALIKKKEKDDINQLAKLEQKYIQNLEDTLKEKTEEIEIAYNTLTVAHAKSLEMLAHASDYRDDDTGLHIIKIGEYSRILAKNFGLSDNDIDLIHHAAPMHDVGKIGIPDSILRKKGKLTPEEFEIIKTHTVIGAQIFFDSAHPYHTTSGIIALTHHEKWDGTGYPRQLKNQEIHVFGRIVAVVDVYDALITKRIYKKAWPEEKALELIQSQKGKHFDPEIAQCFIDSISEIKESKNRIEEEEKNSSHVDMNIILDNFKNPSFNKHFSQK